MGNRRKLYNEELHSLNHSSNIGRLIEYRRLKRAENSVRVSKGTRTFKILTNKSKDNMPLERSRCRGGKIFKSVVRHADP